MGVTFAVPAGRLQCSRSCLHLHDASPQDMLRTDGGGAARSHAGRHGRAVHVVGTDGRARCAPGSPVDGRCGLLHLLAPAALLPARPPRAEERIRTCGVRPSGRPARKLPFSNCSSGAGRAHETACTARAATRSAAGLLCRVRASGTGRGSQSQLCYTNSLQGAGSIAAALPAVRSVMAIDRLRCLRHGRVENVVVLQYHCTDTDTGSIRLSPESALTFQL